METFAPLISLLVLLSVLSITAERLTNTFKLRRPAIRTAEKDAAKEKEREKHIDSGLHVVVFEGGEGGGIALVTRSGTAVVIDASRSGSNGERIARFLRDEDENGVAVFDRVLLAFATHYDADHINGFPGLSAAGIAFDTVYDQGPSFKRLVNTNPNTVYNRYVRSLFGEDAVEPAVRKTAAPGLRWDLGGQVSIRVLSAMGDTYGSANDIDLDPSTRDIDENCGSIALLVRLGQFELYTAGDPTSDDWRAFQDTEMAVVNSAAFGSNRDVDVLKVNHHGSESSNGPRFLHALDPEVAIISSRLGQHHIPKAITVQELLRNGAVVYITGDALDDDGLFLSSNATDRDDGFTEFPADSVINAAGDVHIYVARNGLSYRVVTAAGSAEYSAVDADNPHTFEYAEGEYLEHGGPGVSSTTGLPRCKG